jgi:hypothetical protein
LSDEEQTEPEGLEPGVTSDEARKAAQGATPEDVEELVPVVRVAKKHSNLDQTLIEVTGDRTKIILTETADKLAKRREWPGPLGLFVGLGMSVLTANFKKTFGLEADTVKGIVMTAAAGAALWTLWTLVRAVTTPSRKKVVELCIEALKHQGSA